MARSFRQQSQNLDRSSQPQPPIPTRGFGTILSNVLDGIYAANQLKIHNFVAGVHLNLTTPRANLGLVPFLLAPFRTAKDMPAIPPYVRVEELRGRRKQTMRSLAGRQGMGLEDSEDRSVEIWGRLEDAGGPSVDHNWFIGCHMFGRWAMAMPFTNGVSLCRGSTWLTWVITMLLN